MSRIVVIGAGITGVTTAYALLERGHQVTVLERHPYAAMETSFANGGQLSACNSEVWNSPSTILKGLKWMFRKDAPLLMRLAPSWHKYSWLGEFVWNIQNYRQNTIETTKLAIEARRHLFAVAECENIKFDLQRCGILHVYHDKNGFESGLRVNELLQQGGLDRKPVTPDEIRAIEPAIQTGCYGGFFTPSDSTGDIHKFTRGLADACKRRGATFVFEVDVNEIVQSGAGYRISWVEENRETKLAAEADAIVVCAGVASRDFARMLGDRINIYPVKGYSITVGLGSTESQTAAPWVSLLDEAAKIVTSRLGADRLRIAGTAEFAGIDRDIRMDRIVPLVDWVRRYFPNVDTSDVKPWAGLRPMMPDMMPVVRPGKRAGIYYNTGHGHLGWTLSAATAEIVTDAIGEGERTQLRSAA